MELYNKFIGWDNCENVVMLMLIAKKLDSNCYISSVPKDLVKLLCEYVWRTRAEDDWNFDPEKQSKRIKFAEGFGK